MLSWPSSLLRRVPNNNRQISTGRNILSAPQDGNTSRRNEYRICYNFKATFVSGNKYTPEEELERLSLLRFALLRVPPFTLIFTVLNGNRQETTTFVAENGNAELHGGSLDDKQRCFEEACNTNEFFVAIERRKRSDRTFASRLSFIGSKARVNNWKGPGGPG